MSRAASVAILGATGLVGRTFLEILAQREFPIAELRLLASERSEGKEIEFRGDTYRVAAVSEGAFKGVDIALFSAGAERSKTWAPIASSMGATVVDNSSAFRMQREVPLVVPEVNAHVLNRNDKIIANPNCSTIQVVMVAKPLHQAAGIKRMVLSTYQSVSGSGQAAIAELDTQIEALSHGQTVNGQIYAHQIAYNALPHIDSFTPSGYTREEVKMMQESRKIMELPDLRVTATCVRVPVRVGHSVSVNLELERELSPESAREILAESAGVTVVDTPEKNLYPLAINCAGKDETFVGRIRGDESVPHGLNLWVVADNLRKGAALNAVQIAEHLLQLSSQT